ncbi:hypothetical protein EDB80DRAFT_812412 [Ilyonectria destructans]|nr:hypothetical protein EDB80DRAFT_812412 [Ilyonectria destructans]
MNITMTEFQPFHILTPSPILGYGYDVDQFWAAVRETTPAAIILDAGSTDPGPYMLGTGKTLCSRQSYVRDLGPILEACSTYGIKLLLGSAGGAGTNAQVDLLVDIMREIATQKSYSFRLATIKFDDNRDAAISKLETGNMHPCSSSPPLQVEDIRDAVTVVAQMGVEPFLEALKDPSVDIIVAGRSYDPSPFAAFCMHNGVQESAAWHVGKIIECGGLCTIPKGRSILATMFEDCFVLTPTSPEQKCTPISVAAHTLYEKSRPDSLPGPGGVLHLDGCTYTQQPDGRSLLVKGSHFVPSPVYQVKLEGVKALGFRSIFIGGIRDPILINGIDEFLETVKKTVKDAFPALHTEGGPRIIFHLYGKNAVMGEMESETRVSHEIGILGEAVAETQDLADAVSGFCRTVVLHGSYKDQLATAGNLASPLTPLDTPVGPVFKFSVYHLMDIDDPRSPFPVAHMSLGTKSTDLQQNKKQFARKCTAKVSSSKLAILDSGIVATASRQEHRNSPTLKEIARVIRSKNSGPFEVTLDVLFGSISDYLYVKDSNVLTADLVERLYRLKSSDDIVTCMFYEPALAWKCTFKRYQAQGSIGERDTFGAQMHAPMLEVVVRKEQNATE